MTERGLSPVRVERESIEEAREPAAVTAWSGRIKSQRGRTRKHFVCGKKGFEARKFHRKRVKVTKCMRKLTTVTQETS